MARFPLPILALGAVLATTATPALAQNFNRDDIVVYGHTPIPDDVESVSQHVSYGDLHLQYAEDRRELRRRVTLTAHELCDSLGEGHYARYASSCYDTAYSDAMRQVRYIEARYEQPRYYADTAHVWLPPRDWANEDSDWRPRYPAR